MHTFTESDDYLKRRGQYSILRAVHEEKKDKLRDILTVTQTWLNEAFKLATADSPRQESINDWMAGIRKQIDIAEQTAKELVSLAEQRQELKEIIWPKQ